jgi:CO/xanthine dehydrogenase Mo-binding subunit
MPGSPISAFAVESVLDMLAKRLGMDPLQLRLKNAARAGTPIIYGPKLGELIRRLIPESSRHGQVLRIARHLC